MTCPRYCRSPQAVWRATRSFVVLSVPPGAPRAITGSASMVWEQLAKAVTLDELVEQLSAVASAPAPQIRADVVALLGELVSLDLVEVRQ